MTYGPAATGAATATTSLAFTGDHIASMIVFALGMAFMGGALLRATRRRVHRP
jgi:hypothetical protein